MLFRVELSTNSMKLYPIVRKAFEERARASRLCLAESTGKPNGKEEIIVTASTTNLEAFIRWNIKDKTFFSGDPAYSFSRVVVDTPVTEEAANATNSLHL